MEIRYVSLGNGTNRAPVAAYTGYHRAFSKQAQFFCIHRTLNHGPRGPWTVTHVPTGLAFGTQYPSRHQAQAALREMLEMQKLYAYTGEDFTGDMRTTQWWKESRKWYNYIVKKFFGGLHIG